LVSEIEKNLGNLLEQDCQRNQVVQHCGPEGWVCWQENGCSWTSPPTWCWSSQH